MVKKIITDCMNSEKFYTEFFLTYEMFIVKKSVLLKIAPSLIFSPYLCTSNLTFYLECIVHVHSMWFV